MRETPTQQDQRSRNKRDEIDILGYLAIVRKRALLISILSITGLVLSLTYSYSLADRYKAKAVISPVKEGGASTGISVLVQQIESVPGMSLSSPSSSGEILALLNSNMLRKKTIEQFDLLPVIFGARWDSEKNDWEAGKEKPSVHEGLRALERAISVKHSPKDNTITITSESASPAGAAAVIEKLLQVLNTHLSSEARRVAESNRDYLEGQLKYTADPLIRQNIYGLIAQQIESSMMAGVMENFAFKVIDPPEAPDMKSSPKRHIIIAAGFGLSLSAGVLLAFGLEFFEARRYRRKSFEKN
ncbi:MAG: hypothetical protein IT362_04750 [Deltaproteobacteria bacterium]|nr:hypothetical protein [Deltaproteobacteria bacterium]